MPEPAAMTRIQDVFQKQQQHRWVMARTTAAERCDRLRRLKEAVVAGRGELRQALAADFSKHAIEVELTEIQPTLGEISHTIRHLHGWMRPRRVGTPLLLAGTRSQIRCEPKGVVLILAPWNYPFNLAVNPLVAAIAAGNCVMLRPSNKVPATAAFLKALVERVFPEEEAAVFLGDHAVGTALLELPFDHIFFTGSTSVGRQIMAAAARHLASVTLELGGKSPAIVDETADVRAAARRVTWGKFLNGGQTCVAPDYAFVHASQYAAFVREAGASIAQFYGVSDEARAATPDFCRMVDRASCGRLKALIDESVAQGAVLEAGGQADEGQRFVAPTLLSNVTIDSPIMQGEIFGPVLPVLRYQSLGEVYAYTRAHGKPLALYVFSGSHAAAEQIIDAIPAGGSCINNVILHLANPNLPFGGAGESGQGSYHGHFGFKAFSHERAVVTQGFPALAGHFYPPYRPRIERLVRWVTKVAT